MPADPGQFTAQLTAIGAIMAFTVIVFGVPAITLHKAIRAQHTVEIEEAVEAPARTASEQVADGVRRQEKAQSLQPVAATQAVSESDDMPPAIPAPATLGELPLHSPAASVPANGNGSEPAGAPNESAPGRSLLDRIRRGRTRPDEEEKPARARHVAYPNRGPARRVIIRPLTTDPPAQPSAPDES
jgi:hypothetical protein